jgi:hypothetical protein
MSPLFLRIYQHLLPTGQAWRTTVDKTLRRFFAGLSDAPQDVVNFADAVYLDAFPATTRELAEWEAEFGLEANPVEATRRLNLAAEWAATGGQSPGYIQGVLQTAGFDVYIHEWWSSGPPYVARDPNAYTEIPLIGEYQCASDGDWDQPQCTGFDSNGTPLDGQPQCNAFLANDPGYLVNKDLSPRPPPPIPDGEEFWPFFMYVGGATFPNHATVDVSRRAEFERLILKLRPTHLWIVTGLVDYTSGGGSGVFDSSFDLSFN